MLTRRVSEEDSSTSCFLAHASGNHGQVGKTRAFPRSRTKFNALRIVAVLLLCAIAPTSVVAQQRTELYQRIVGQTVEVNGKEMPRVRSEYDVRLDNMQLTREEFASLAHWSRLRTLSLRGTNVTDADLLHLAGLKHLRVLVLDSTEITDEATAVLATFSLWTLCIGDTKVSAEAVRELEETYARRDWRVAIGYHSGEQPVTSDVTDWHQVCCSSESETNLDVKWVEANSQEEMKPYEERIEHTKVKIRMLPIRGGEFMMGSPKSEPDRIADEGPQRLVKIDPFWMAETETTWDAYEVWAYDQDVQRRKGLNRTKMKRDQLAERYQLSQPTPPYMKMDYMGRFGCPAVCMTQLSARTFCKWLSEKTGRYYRLPTEAEWEYACRAGTETAYSWGDDPKQIDEYAWFYENSPNEYYQKVRMKRANPWGLYDMHGNVAEWCLDQYDLDFYRNDQSKVSDNPLNIPKTIYPRVVRGGSYMDDPDRLRSAAREGSNPKWKQQDPAIPPSIWWHTDAYWVGFRIVRPLKRPSEDELAAKWDRQKPERQREDFLKRRYD